MRMRKSPPRVRPRWKEQDGDGKVLETNQTTDSTNANGKRNTCRIARNKTIKISQEQDREELLVSQ